jgi:hypothetical protein
MGTWKENCGGQVLKSGYVETVARTGRNSWEVEGNCWYLAEVEDETSGSLARLCPLPSSLNSSSPSI